MIELQANAGTQFDARCVQALVDVVGDAVVEQPTELHAEREPYRAVTRIATGVRAA
jgi:HD-GYP domain-containing protein (c-di-GMP phosphodiesterase class II)